MVLVQHGQVKALLQERVGEERSIQATHIYKVRILLILISTFYTSTCTNSS